MKSIGQLFGKVAKKALAAHGGPVLPELLRVWPELFPDLAGIARPLKVERAGRQPGTLRLQVQPGQALMVQMCEQQIIARVNAHLGHAAIRAVRYVQAPWAERQARTPPAPDADVLQKLTARLKQHHDPELRAALERLAQGIATDAAARERLGERSGIN